MAGDWIMMRANLSSDPHVIKVARLLDCSEFKVVGLLHWLGSWADSHTEDGKAVGIDCKWINEQAKEPEFCNALLEVGWLILHEDGIEIPNFAHHNGASAKSRANTARRVAKHKAKTQAGYVPKPAQKAAPRTRSKTSKTQPLLTLLQGEYRHLLEDEEKAQSLKDWIDHLNQRLTKTYSDGGANALLKRIDEMTADELQRGVEFSLEGNYQKLVIPKEYHGQQRQSGPRYEEYPD